MKQIIAMTCMMALLLTGCGTKKTNTNTSAADKNNTVTQDAENGMENAGDRIQEGMDNAGDAVENGMDNAGDAVENGMDRVGDNMEGGMANANDANTGETMQQAKDNDTRMN